MVVKHSDRAPAPPRRTGAIISEVFHQTIASLYQKKHDASCKSYSKRYIIEWFGREKRNRIIG